MCFPLFSNELQMNRLIEAQLQMPMIVNPDYSCLVMQNCDSHPKLMVHYSTWVYAVAFKSILHVYLCNCHICWH